MEPQLQRIDYISNQSPSIPVKGFSHPYSNQREVRRSKFKYSNPVANLISGIISSSKLFIQ
jgi:hypothetical protein